MPELQLEKLFRSTEELTKPEIAQINGKVPEWIKGTFLRTGPGLWDFNSGFTMNHFFDGYAILSKFIIEGDIVRFEKKFLQSDAYLRSQKAGKPVLTEFGTRAFKDPNKSMFSRFLSAIMPIELTDNDSVNLFQLGEDVYATSETNFFRQIDPCSLSCVGDKCDVNKFFGCNVASAHCLRDTDGTMYNIGFSVITGLKYNIFKIPAPASNQSSKNLMGKAKIICSIPSSFAFSGMLSYCHSFAMTKKYIVFVEQPYVMDIKKAALCYMKNPSFNEYLTWREGTRNKFWVIEKETGKVLKTEYMSKDPFFFLHMVNAYEENDQIVLDINSYENAEMFDSLYIADLRDGKMEQKSKAAVHRYVLPLVDLKNTPEGVDLVAVKSDATAVRTGDSITVAPQILTEEGIEMPIINKKYQGKKYSYLYSAGIMSGAFLHSIMKYDAKKNETVVWKETGTFPGEPQFIPKPGGIREDDGVLISAVTDTRPGANDFLLVLDATTMEELGRAQFKAHIPIAFHGLFMN